MLELQAGDYVECIDNQPDLPNSVVMPDADRLYTVEEIRAVARGYSVRLNELAPSCYQGGTCACGNCGWDARRFRRVYRPHPRNLEPFQDMLHAPKPAIADPVSLNR